MIQLKWPEKNLGTLSLLISFFYFVVAAVSRFLYSPFRGSSGAPIYEQDVAYAVIRQILSRLSAEQTQGLTATTEDVYLAEAAKLSWTPNTVSLDGKANGHWLGDSNAEYVMLYFHGGGYIGYATPGHLKYQFALQEAMRDAGHSFSIFSVSYQLAPSIVYPQQLNQALSALRYLIEHEQTSPKKILLAGDSAGGNLAAALLLHIARPHPLVDAIQLSSKIRAALLISPWVSFDTSYPSYTANASSDYLTKRAVERASSAFVGLDEDGTPKAHDLYSEPIQVPLEWWKAVADHVVEDLAVWGGGGEILIDGIRIFADNVAAGFANAEATTKRSSNKGGGQAYRARDLSKMSRNQYDIETMNGERDKSGIDDTSVSERCTYIETPRASHEEQIMNHTLFVTKQESAIVIEDWVDSRLQTAN